MLIAPSFKKSFIVEQFQGNYLKLQRVGRKEKLLHSPKPKMAILFTSSQSTVRFPRGLNRVRHKGSTKNAACQQKAKATSSLNRPKTI